jgi:autotransporter-associated beta strand protein
MSFRWQKRLPSLFRSFKSKPETYHWRGRTRLQLEALEDRLALATHAWTNAAGTGLWSNALNWTGGKPTTGESGGTIVVLGTVSNQLTSTQDIAGLVVDQIQFTTNSGNTIKLTNQNLGLNGANLVSNILDSSGGTDTITGSGAGQGLVLSGASAGVNVSGGSTVTIQSKITGNVGLVTQSAGTLNLFGAAGNTYTGVTNVTSGTLQLDNTNGVCIPGTLVIGDGTGAAGSAIVREMQNVDIASTAAVTINNDGLFDLNGFTDVIGSLASNAGASTAQVSLGTGSLAVGNAASTTFAGVISGAGGNLSKVGAGTLSLVGSAANTYTGTTQVNDGTLQLNKTLGVSIPGALVIGDGSGVSGSAEVRELQSSDIAATAAVTINNDGLFDLNGFTDLIGSLASNAGPSTAQVNLGNGTLTVGSAASSTYSGNIAGVGGSLNKLGSGTLTLSGASTYTGSTMIIAGALEIDGNDAGSPVMLSAGVLQGTSTVKSINTTGGTVSPGAGGQGAIGTLTTAAGAFASSLSGATYSVDVDTPTASDLLAIGNGATINLAGGILSVNVLGSTPNNIYTIISSPSDGISGTFNGLANNTIFAAGAHVFRISYAPDRVTLTDVQTQVGAISGTVYRDFNLNGKQDSGEPGVVGVPVFLDLNDNGVPDAGEPTATTNANGAYSFVGLTPDTYVVRQVLLGGTILSVPSTGSYSLTVAGGSNFANQDFAEVFTSITVPLTLPPTTPFPAQGNANADFVEAVYRAVLNRNADQGGLSSWTGHLNGGTYTRLQVVQGIRNSPEHFGQEIDAFYETLLGRAADPAGRAGWVGQLQNGVREEQIAFDFLNSPEYLGKGDKFFIDAMYESLLGRSFDPTGEAGWLNALGDDASGNPTHPATTTHAAVINAFLFSSESLNRLVEGYYEVFLQRQADPGGLSGWVTQLQGGLPFLTIGQEFVSSDEFFNKAAANN